MPNPQKNKTIIVISLVTIAAGLMVMAGWVFNIKSFQSIAPGLVPMAFNIALCFALFGTALLVTQFQSSKYQALVFFVLSLVGTLIGAVTLSEYLFHFNFGLDQLFVTDWRNRFSISPYELTLEDKGGPSNTFYPGRMSLNSAVCLTLLGLGLLLLTVKKKAPVLIAQYIFHAVDIFASTILIGFLYGVSLVHTLLYAASMSMQTAVFFTLISLAASLLNPTVGITGLFTGSLVGNKMIRRLFGLIILVVIVFGALRIETSSYQLSLNAWVAIVCISFLLVCLLILWNTAIWLNKIDSSRAVAEEEIARINLALEKIVEDRTLAFQKSEAKYRLLIEQASDAIYVVDYQGRFTEVNASICKMTGYTKEELLRMNVEQIIDPEQLKTDPIKHGPRTPDEYGMRERRLKRKDGSIFDAEINVKRFQDDRVLVIARDITDRKYAEEVILKEKTLSDTIINSLPGAFYLFTDEGKYLRWNSNFEAVMGYNSKEIANLNPINLVAPEDQKVVRAAIEKVFEEGYAVIEANIISKDGIRTPMLLTGTPILYEGERCLLGMGIDISARVKAEEELRASEQKYKMLFDSSPMPLWMIDKDTLNIIAVNDVAASLYGYGRGELLNMNVRQLRPPDDHERQLAGYLRGESDEAIDMGVVRHLKKDGTRMYVHIVAHDIEFEGRPVRLSYTNDITERLKAEQSLQKSQANLQTILKTTKTAYALFDAELKVLAVNQKGIEFTETHYNHTPQKGDRLADYFPAERFPQFLGFAREVLHGKDINYEIDYPRLDGGIVWFDIRLSPIINDNREIIGMLMTLDEITERKNAEQALKKAYDRIQSQLNSIRGMAWKQSHLMRSPLANLKALADLLTSQPDDTQSLAHFQTELDRLDAIIREMAKEASEHDE